MKRQAFLLGWMIVTLLSSCARPPAPAATLLPAAASATAPVPAGQGEMAAWPTDEWQVSTPEAQGIDPALLTAMVEFIEQRDVPIDAVFVTRHGYVVLEVYFPPYRAGQTHELYSCTKSVTSALIGIAIAQGYLSGVDVPVADVLPEWEIGGDALKAAVTVQDLLTMEAGLDWPEGGVGGSDPLMEMVRTGDWVEFVAARPMVAEPGQVWLYNTGASHLLSAIVQETTGMPAARFAQQTLFGPIGIDGVSWTTAPEGVTVGGFGLKMTPPDLARLGYLYLNEGLWDGQQVVPADWVAQSTIAHAQVDPGLEYGYQWWITDEGFQARGLYGQHVWVVPDLDLVAVFFSDIRDESMDPEYLMRQYVLPAVETD